VPNLKILLENISINNKCKRIKNEERKEEKLKYTSINGIINKKEHGMKLPKFEKMKEIHEEMKGTEK
jgi:hypothetical protein